MNIVLMSNTYTPHVGGVARSVEAFRNAYRRKGHRVLVVAPDYPDMPREEDVIRIPAIQNFNASDFSVALPVPQGLTKTLTAFKPDIVHSQHPFLLGMTALRTARIFDIPLVFTHHTLYEEYTHYVPGDSIRLKAFVIELGTRYAESCDMVFTPSNSIADLLRKRGVRTRIEVIPTGVEPEKFARGDGAAFRQSRHIPSDAFVIGHMGRLAEEKNLDFLAKAVLAFMKNDDRSVFLVVGSGDFETAIRELFRREGMEQRLVMTGTLQNQALADSLHAMDVFTFASFTETQGMVLTEAMAAGVPVIALQANGVRDVLKHEVNGFLVPDPDIEDFTGALKRYRALDETARQRMIGDARRTADEFSMESCADAALASYSRVCREAGPPNFDKDRQWEQILNRLEAEWEILKSLASAGEKAFSTSAGEGAADTELKP